MTIEAWLLFCLIEAVLCLNPGPSALVVMSLAVTRGPAHGVKATAGVISANALYFGVAATGLVAVHALSEQGFTAIKWCGAGYLFWLGGRALWKSFGPHEEGAGGVAVPGTVRPYVRGFLVQGANPNLLVYFGAILPQFVDPARAVAPQIAILAVSSFIIEFVILSSYSALIGGVGRRASRTFGVYVERAGGVLLLAAAVGVASLTRD